MTRTIRVCQNTTCRKQGSAEVLSAFERSASDTISVEGSGCLGHCGSGPNVLILPENEWYLHVRPKDVETLLSAHLEETKVEARSGTQSDANRVFRLWLMVIGGLIGAIALAAWLIAKNSYYI